MSKSGKFFGYVSSQRVDVVSHAEFDLKLYSPDFLEFSISKMERTNLHDILLNVGLCTFVFWRNNKKKREIKKKSIAFPSKEFIQAFKPLFEWHLIRFSILNCFKFWQFPSLSMQHKFKNQLYIYIYIRQLKIIKFQIEKQKCLHHPWLDNGLKIKV